jgi:hypothetical protein
MTTVDAPVATSAFRGVVRRSSTILVLFLLALQILAEQATRAFHERPGAEASAASAFVDCTNASRPSAPGEHAPGIAGDCLLCCVSAASGAGVAVDSYTLPFARLATVLVKMRRARAQANAADPDWNAGWPLRAPPFSS